MSFLGDVKAGDELIRYASGLGNDRLVKVKRVTKTQIIIRMSYGEERFNKDSGRLRGNSNSYNICYLQKPTPETRRAVLLAMKRCRAYSAIRELERHSNKLSEAVLDMVLEANRLSKD